jgi:DNA repair ATPase RecN
VASVASHQLLIKKTQLNDKTKVSVFELNKEERIIEIAKMLSDGNATSKSLELAKELLNE